MMKAILFPWLAAYLLGRKPPITDFALAKSSPHYIMWHEHQIENQQIDPYAFLSRLSHQFNSHMYQYHKLSPTIGYGNAALAIAQPWLKLAAYRHDGDGVMNSVKAFFSRLSPPLAAALEWRIIEKGSFNAAYPRRRSCCLKYRINGKEKCATCNKENREIQHTMLVQKMVNT